MSDLTILKTQLTNLQQKVSNLNQKNNSSSDISDKVEISGKNDKCLGDEIKELTNAIQALAKKIDEMSKPSSTSSSSPVSGTDSISSQTAPEEQAILKFLTNQANYYTNYDPAHKEGYGFFKAETKVVKPSFIAKLLGLREVTIVNKILLQPPETLNRLKNGETVIVRGEKWVDGYHNSKGLHYGNLHKEILTSLGNHGETPICSITDILQLMKGFSQK